jgi:hypothetical protein
MEEETEFVEQKRQSKEEASASSAALSDVSKKEDTDTEIRFPRSATSGSNVTNVEVVKRQAIPAELVSKESFILRKQDPLQAATDGFDDDSLLEDIGDEAGIQFSDEFCHKVAAKTQKFGMPQRIAVMEVIIDELLQRRDSKEKVLLHIIREYEPEYKVRTYAERLLSVHKTSPVVADDQMKSCLHYAVEKKYLSVVQVLLDHDAYVLAKDKDGRMAVEIAISMKNDAIAACLVSKMPHDRVRSLFEGKDKPAQFTFQNLITEQQMQETVMAVLDSMMDSVEGQPDRYRVFYNILDGDWNGRAPDHLAFVPSGRSCLQIIAKSNNKEAVYHDVVRLLLRHKWKTYIGVRFRFQATLFICFLVTLTFALVVAGSADDPLFYDSPLQILRGLCEMFVALHWLWDLVSELNQLRKHKLNYFSDYYNYLDISSVTFLFAILPLRLAESDVQWTIASFGYLATSLRIFKYASASRTVGQYARICGRIIREDMTRFAILFLLFLVTFSGSLFLALRGESRTVVNGSNPVASDLHLFSETRLTVHR